MNSLQKINSSEKYSNIRKRSGTFFQPKLTINKPDDQYEREADKVAGNIMQMSVNDNYFFRPAPISSVQRKCAECEEEDKIQMKGNIIDEVNADRSFEAYAGSLNSGGHAMSSGERSFFEPRFGYDFSNVRIHNDSAAAKSAHSINALAYTSGNNIVFNQNQYSPDTDTGKKLLAHELTHVIQQSNNGMCQIQKKDEPGSQLKMEDTPCERASLRREAKIPCPGEKDSELIIKPCIWTMFKNYGPCGIYIYPILKDTPTLKAYGELTEIEPGETKNVAAPKECIRFEVGCSSNCDTTGDTRIRWGPPCAV